ncbi:MAG TPA: SMC family ATPase [Acidobacteriota bacterium]|nr:SMC family ATPase [Acidobacteriota bacterium]
MRPIRLELEGFTCFKRKVEIDFSKLDLFAITGPTGSGKTSLLDAVIFALYGRTPRLGPGQASDLISQGLLRLSVLLEFQASGRRWRIARTLRHTARATVSKPRLEAWKEEEWEPRSSSVSQIKDLVEKIVGLDFDGFTKSVVLPQGEFDRFLKGSPTERRKILTELLGLHIYELMGKRARELAEIARNTADVKQEQLEKSYAEATPEARRDLKKQLARLKGEAEDLEKRLKAVQEAEPLAAALRLHKSKLKEISQDIEEISDRRQENQNDLEKAEKDLQEQQSKIAEREKQLEESGYEEERFLQLAQLKSEAEEWERLGERETARSRELRELEERREKLDEERLQAEKSLKAAEESLQQARRQEERRRQQLAQAVELHGSAEAVGQTLQRAAELGRLRSDLEERSVQLDQAVKRKTQTQEKLKSAEREMARAEQALKEADREYERLRRLHSAEDLRRHLQEGEPCPVCLQEVGRLPGQVEHQALEEAQQARQQASQAERRAREQVSSLKGDLQSLPRQIETLEQSVGDHRRSLQGIEKQVESALGSRPETDPAPRLKELLQRLQDLHKKVDEAAQEGTRQERRTAQERESAQQAAHRLELVAGEINARQSQQADDRRRRQHLQSALKEWLDGSGSIQAFRRQLQAQQKARALSRRLQAELAALKEKQREIHSLLQRLGDRLENDAQQLDKQRQRLRDEEESRDQVEKKLKKALRALFEELPLFEEGTDQEAVEEDPAAQLEKERSQVEERLKASRSQSARGEERLEQLQQRIEQAGQLRKEIQEERENASVAHELGLALRANQLISFIQEEAFRRLAEDGTRHLRELSSQRYSFEVEGDRFAVLDHWNADEARPVNTLSGGESFLASLSLALALAESLSEFVGQRRQLSLDSLFLDEGFSTLDQETLDVVVQSVETLAGGERLIGVISHVPELAERFPSRIVVSKSIAGSSIEVE